MVFYLKKNLSIDFYIIPLHFHVLENYKIFSLISAQISLNIFSIEIYMN